MLRIELQNNEKKMVDNQTTNFIENKFNHVAFTYNREKIEVYGNGQKLSTESNFSGDLEPELRLSFGSNEKVGEILKGCICEVKIFKKALSLKEIKKQMFLIDEDVINHSSIIGYWPLNESLTNMVNSKDAKIKGKEKYKSIDLEKLKKKYSVDSDSDSDDSEDSKSGSEDSEDSKSGSEDSDSEKDSDEEESLPKFDKKIKSSSVKYTKNYRGVSCLIDGNYKGVMATKQISKYAIKLELGAVNIGYAPKTGFNTTSYNYDQCGFYLYSSDGNLYAKGISSKSYTQKFENGSIIGVSYNKTKGKICYYNGKKNLGVAYENIKKLKLYPAFDLDLSSTICQFKFVPPKFKK
jgi:hypothetical protein